MFSSKLYRAAVAAPSPALTAQRTASQCLASTTTRRVHQRRHSSSKPTPPSDSSATKAAPAAKAAQTTEGGERSSRKAGRVKRSSSEAEKAGAKEAASQETREERAARGLARKAAARDAAAAKEVFAGVPRVDETDIEKKDFVLSSFFSLHRPLNLTSPMPLPISDEAWAGVLQPPPADPWANGNSAQRRPEDEIIAPASTMRLLNPQSSTQNSNLHWEVLQESPSNSSNGVRHLDQPPPPAPKTFDDLVAQFRPFHAPPPPEPIAAESKRPVRRAARVPKTSRPKVYRTTLDFTESQTPDGQLSYTVTQTPLVPVSAPGFYTPSASFLQHRSQQKSYISRLRASQRSSQYLTASERQTMREPNALRIVRKAPGLRKLPQMRLISVKRQRKLKMKKHKYKKLMKRTRNLRRRLDRA